MSDTELATKPIEESKPLAKSLTVRASIAQAVVPLIAFWLSRKLGLGEEDAMILAGALFAALASLAQIGMRRAIGALLFLLVMVGCHCNRCDILIRSGRRFADGPGQGWIDCAASGEERGIREDRVEAYRLVLDLAEEDNGPDGPK